MTFEHLGETIKWLGSFDMIKETALAKYFEHQTLHKGQTAVHLR